MADARGPARRRLDLLTQAVRIHREIGDPRGMVYDLIFFARVLAWTGNAEAAGRLLSCVESLQEEFGMSEPWFTEFNEKTLTSIRDQLGEAALAETWQQGRKLTIDVALALALDSVGEHAA